MKHDPNGPAGTRDMGIVHSALRRDLERACQTRRDCKKNGV